MNWNSNPAGRENPFFVFTAHEDGKFHLVHACESEDAARAFVEERIAEGVATQAEIFKLVSSCGTKADRTH